MVGVVEMEYSIDVYEDEGKVVHILRNGVEIPNEDVAKLMDAINRVKGIAACSTILDLENNNYTHQQVCELHQEMNEIYTILVN